MAHRNTFLATDFAYHVYNHSVSHVPFFKSNKVCTHFLETLEYYLQEKPPIRYSAYRKYPNSFELDFTNTLVDVMNFCLMPTHFHFTLLQKVDNGIKIFIQKLSVSFSHYYRLRHKTMGHLFTGNFKANLVETDEELTHLSRYIHLNPVTSGLVKNPEDYFYSSYNQYLGKDNGFNFVKPDMILSHFPNNSKYKEFVEDQINYQKELYKIKHLTKNSI